MCGVDGVVEEQYLALHLAIIHPVDMLAARISKRPLHKDLDIVPRSSRRFGRTNRRRLREDEVGQRLVQLWVQARRI